MGLKRDSSGITGIPTDVCSASLLPCATVFARTLRIVVTVAHAFTTFLSVLAPLTVVLLFYGTVLVLVVVHWY